MSDFKWVRSDKLTELEQKFAYPGHYYHWAIVCAKCSRILERVE